MEVLNVSSSVADLVIGSMERSGVNERTVTPREFVVAARAAYADYRDHVADRDAPPRAVA